jgi:hypothetical protein
MVWLELQKKAAANQWHEDSSLTLLADFPISLRYLGLTA